ncbi:MAG: hypothetical protein WA902_21470, partial [Thermosynechococcaceae cyanobacterium]
MIIPAVLGRGRLGPLIWAIALTVVLTIGSGASAQPVAEPSVVPAALVDPLPTTSPNLSGDTSTRNLEAKKSLVVLQGQTLFEIKAGVGSFSSDFRAQVISERLQKFAQRYDLELSAIIIVDNQKTQTTDLKVNGETLVTLLDTDAKAANTTRQKLAQDYLAAIQAAVANYRDSFRLQNILLGLLYAVLLTIATIIIFSLTNRAIAKLNAQLRLWQGNRIRGFRLFRTEVLHADRVVDVLTELTKLGRLAFFLLLGVIYANLLLSCFPWTKAAAQRLFQFLSWTLAQFGEQFISYLPNLFFLGLIILLTTYTLRLIQFFFTQVRRGDINLPGFYPEWAKPTYNLVRF